MTGGQDHSDGDVQLCWTFGEQSTVKGCSSLMLSCVDEKTRDIMTSFMKAFIGNTPWIIDSVGAGVQCFLREKKLVTLKFIVKMMASAGYQITTDSRLTCQAVSDKKADVLIKWLCTSDDMTETYSGDLPNMFHYLNFRKIHPDYVIAEVFQQVNMMRPVPVAHFAVVISIPRSSHDAVIVYFKTPWKMSEIM
jgi:hypothetical protein